MKILIAGHRYAIQNLEPNPETKSLRGLAEESYQVGLKIEHIPAGGPELTEASVASSALTQKLLNQEYAEQEIQFIQKEAVHEEGCLPGYCKCTPTLKTINNGTTNEEVLAVLIDRIKTLNAKLPCKENSVALTHLETAELWLLKRTRDRQARAVEGTAKA